MERASADARFMPMETHTRRVLLLLALSERGLALGLVH